jgi:hypothetical protein
MKKSLIIIFISLLGFVSEVKSQEPTKQETREFINNKIHVTIYDDGFNISTWKVPARYGFDAYCKGFSGVIFFKDVTSIAVRESDTADTRYIVFKGKFSVKNCDFRQEQITDHLMMVDLSHSEEMQVIKAFKHICKLNGAVFINQDLFKD